MIRSTDLLSLAGALARGGSESDAAHAFFWRRLENAGHPVLKSAGSALVQLRRQRNRADYDLGETVIQRDANAAITRATETIRSIDSLGPDDRRAAIEIIKAYERDVLRETTWRPRPR